MIIYTLYNTMIETFRNYETHGQILFEIVKFIKISRSLLNCHYVGKNNFTNSNIDVKQPQSIDNTPPSPSCIPISALECDRSCNCAYKSMRYYGTRPIYKSIEINFPRYQIALALVSPFVMHCVIEW